MGDIELGLRLKQAREIAKLTQAETCEKTGIAQVQMLSSYERGVNNPPLDTLKKLSVLYGVSVDSLLFGDDNIPQKEKTPLDYVKQLVDAADHLKLDFENWEDSFSHTDVIALSLLSSPYVGLAPFVVKWSRLRDLLDSEIIEPDEYDGLIKQKLNSLILTKRDSNDKYLFQMTDDTELPF